MNKFILSSLLLIAPLFALPEEEPPFSSLYFGSHVPTPIIHQNNAYAWSGIYPNGTYSPDRAFFHANGTLMWGGIIHERCTFTCDKAYFNYDNGQKAWGGIYQGKQNWSSEEAKFFHPNGQLVWGGLDQNRQYWMSHNAKFYHANGQLAWDGVFGSKVYYENGQVAWDGDPKSQIFDQNGRFVSIADYVNICLGFNNWLYISSERKFELILDLGPGYLLRVKNNTVLLDSYGTIFDITNDF